MVYAPRSTRPGLSIPTKIKAQNREDTIMTIKTLLLSSEKLVNTLVEGIESTLLKHNERRESIQPIRKGDHEWVVDRDCRGLPYYIILV